jgi:Domain of unknown function (DUF3291)
MSEYWVAQVNIGRIRGELDGPVMAGFVARLEEINALADRSAGFVWRLQTEEGNATYLRPYEDQRMLLNMSVWKSVEDLKHRSSVRRKGPPLRSRSRRRSPQELKPVHG